MMVEDLFQRDLSVQLGIQGHEDGAQAAAGMRAQDAEPLAVGGGRADGKVGGAVGIFTGRGQSRAEPSDRGLELGIAEPD